ncbi:DUF4430 domain-containing protein [Clostridium hydrogenum]|uniref:DUF4430 domain-containing protein n=1 Tax=Clostridium hydrogenum TaxID=2855764 RepID=UPI001F3EE3CE|nr:DUF4430 domain-containing protein [Clostridium hydrogenum]
MKKKILLSASVIIVSIILIIGGNAVRDNLSFSSNKNITQGVNKKETVKKASNDSGDKKVDTSTAKSDSKDNNSNKTTAQARSKSTTSNVSTSSTQKTVTASSKTSASSSNSNISSNTTNSNSSAKSVEVKQEANITIVNALDGKTIISTYEDVNGKTVGDVTLDVLKANNISRETTGSGYMLYISAIDGLREKEHGKNSGWIYYVNGESPDIGCGGYKLKTGDKVTWKYSSN